MRSFGKFFSMAGKVIKKELIEIVAEPIVNLAVDSSKEIVTTIGSYFIESLVGKFQKSIQVGIYEHDAMMEEAFLRVMKKYNKIENDPKLCFNDFPISRSDLDDNRLGFAKGYHNLKYKKWNVVLIVDNFKEATMAGECISKGKTYTLICFDFSSQFVKEFKEEMIKEMKLVNQITATSKTIPMYVPVVNDQYPGQRVWFNSLGEIPKRYKQTVFIPDSQMKQIEKVVGDFVKNKDFYVKNSIPYTLNILLYGPPGTGKDTVVKMIASMYNRSLIYIEDSKGGAHIPSILNAENSTNIENPTFVISDIDKYPALIAETEVDLSGSYGMSLSEQIVNKGLFGKMINALDGVMSTQGRIVIMTTNYIDKFDKAFLRDGRVGLKLELGYVTNETFEKFFNHYFKDSVLPEKFTLKNKELTIATLQADIIGGITASEFLKKYLRK